MLLLSRVLFTIGICHPELFKKKKEIQFKRPSLEKYPCTGGKGSLRQIV